MRQPEAVGLDVPLTLTIGTDVYYYLTDANKNVTELIDSQGTVVAHYEYSPFGKTVVSTGALASINPFRFSSEYADDETGLVYYNYRYYSPDLGRWLSRDPIEELGGFNLYNHTGNSPLNHTDKNGESLAGILAVAAAIAVAYGGYKAGGAIADLIKKTGDAIDRMGNTDREKYNDDVSSGKQNATTQCPSTQEDIKTAGEAAKAASGAVPGTSFSGAPPTGAADVIITAGQAAIQN